MIDEILYEEKTLDTFLYKLNKLMKDSEDINITFMNYYKTAW